MKQQIVTSICTVSYGLYKLSDQIDFIPPSVLFHMNVGKNCWKKNSSSNSNLWDFAGNQRDCQKYCSRNLYIVLVLDLPQFDHLCRHYCTSLIPVLHVQLLDLKFYLGRMWEECFQVDYTKHLFLFATSIIVLVFRPEQIA